MAGCHAFLCRFLLLETDVEHHHLTLWIYGVFQGSGKL
jgi:hypothetical protein